MDKDKIDDKKIEFKYVRRRKWFPYVTHSDMHNGGYCTTDLVRNSVSRFSLEWQQIRQAICY